METLSEMEFKTISRCSLISQKCAVGPSSDDDDGTAFGNDEREFEPISLLQYIRTEHARYARFIWPMTLFSSLKQNVCKT